MAETKKYLDQAGLARLWTLVGNKITNTITVDSVAADDKVLKLDGKTISSKLDMTYDSTNKKIKLWGQSNETPIAEVDATAFIKDGMISSADLIVIPGDEAVSAGRPEGTYLKLSFNSDASVDPIYLNVTDLIDVYVGKENEIVVNGQTIELAQAVKTDIATGVQAASDLAAYKTTNDAAVADAKKAGTDAAAALEAYKTTNDAAVASKVAQSAYDTKMGELDGAIADLEDAIGEGGNVATQISNAISANNTNYVDVEVAKKADKATYEAYVESNDAAVADAKKAGTDAAAALNSYKSEMTTTLLGKVNVSDFETFQETNTDAIADAKKAGTDAAAALEAYKTTNDAAVAKKANSADVYTKTDVDTLIADAKKAGTDAAAALEAYQTTNDAAVAKKANAADVYTKGEVDTAVADAKKAGTDAAAALEAYKTTNNAAVAEKANAADVYTKTEVDGKFDALPVYVALTDTEIDDICK